MKIIIDDKIPYIRDAVRMITGDAVYLKGAEISKEDIKDADAMIIRTRTRCDASLLEGTAVRFVATATIGFDHIDTAFMRRAGIAWTNCPGCNSGSVAQYLRSVLLLLERDKGMTLRDMTIGVVGCGHVGSKVKKVAEELGMRVLACDPPLQEKDKSGGFVSMETIKRECDVITFHVPLTTGQPHPTLHLADSGFFDSLPHRPVIINTSRGSVVDNAQLLRALDEGKVSEAVIDTWENEPDISLPLLGKVWIGTPHIAGYSADGKVNADNMSLAALCRHFGITPPPPITPPSLPPDFIPSADKDTLALQLYNPLEDSERLKRSPGSFENLRGNYPLRRETWNG